MLDINDPLVQLKITSATCSSVAIATTTWRLYLRRAQFWYDDGFALVSLVALFLQICSVFLRVPHPSELPQPTRVAAYYILAVTFYTMIWSARLSILFSIIRLDPSERRRKILLYIAALFALVYTILMAQLFWVCVPEPGWRNKVPPQCKLGKQVAISQVVSDVISDSILMIAPLRLLSGLLDKVLRRRLILIFSTCIVTTVVSLVHAAYIVIGGGFKILIAALVEDCLSLIVCNLPVVAAASFRLRKPRDPVESRKSSLHWVHELYKKSRSKTAVATVTLGSCGEDTTLHKSDFTATMSSSPQKPPSLLVIGPEEPNPPV